MFDLNSALTSFRFLIETLQFEDYLDILLVTISIYILLTLIRRSQAAFLLRGIIALALLFLLANLLLPLQTFRTILFYAFLATLIIIPITLQPELRRWLEGFGRRFGFSLNNRDSMAEEVIAPLTRMAENLAATKTGALVVLEGNVPLTEVIASGVPVSGRISSELLQTIFFDKTPLHDGAVVIRGDRVIAAGCVLPLTDRELRGPYRLGTRHRAAIGMSEVSDALSVVVSEETGFISVAKDGRLERNLDRTTLHQRLSDFYEETAETPARGWRPWANWKFKMPSMQELGIDILYFILSFILAVVVTMAVRQQNNPLVSTTMSGVTLKVENLPADTTLTNPLPTTVSVNFQTPASELQALGPNSFQASASLENVVEGANRIPVVVATTADNVLVLGANPEEIDVDVAPIVSEPFTITPIITDRSALSSAYEVRGDTVVRPNEATVTGPQPLVEQIASLEAEVSVAGATTTVNKKVPVFAKAADGTVLTNLTIDPAEVDATVFVRRRIDAKDVGVHTVTVGSPPEDFWLSGLSVTPTSVTIQGDPTVIADIEGYVDTLPVDLNNAIGDISVELPLDLPEGVQALDNEGNVVGNVRVDAQISARTSDLLTGRPVELINDRGTLTVTLQPTAVQLLLSGPVATLNEIEARPEIVRVVIDALDLEPGQSVEIVPEIIAPEGIRAQLIENSVLVTTE